VASIDASGSAKLKDISAKQAQLNDVMAGQAHFEKLFIGGPNIASDSGSLAPGAGTSFAPGAEIETNATAGKSVLLKYEEELIIYNQNITEDSLIYITPLSNPYNKVLYVKNKYVEIETENSNVKSQNYFTVAVDQPINKDIEFNWWIIN
jgi:hypothetical protein